MLTFFRRIRKGLLASGATRKYILYAIGEIALVVIGILIALQINNWNLERIAERTEVNVLKKLMRDLDSDHIRFNEMTSLGQIQLEQMVEFKYLYQKGKNSREDILKMMEFEGAQHYEINPRKTAYDEMINSGNMYKLSNESLLEEIIDYYQNIDNQIYQVRQARNEFRATMFGPHLTDYWTFFSDEKNARIIQALDFFKNRDSQGFKILKQTTGWSVKIVNNQIRVFSDLIEQNRRLHENIQNYLEA